MFLSFYVLFLSKILLFSQSIIYCTIYMYNYNNNYHLFVVHNWKVFWEGNKYHCYIAGTFSQKALTLIGYFEVIWHLTIKLSPAKSVGLGNIAKSTTSKGNNALLPANVNRRPPFLEVFDAVYNKSLKDWSLGKRVSFVSLRISIFPSAPHWKTLRFSGNKINWFFFRNQSLIVLNVMRLFYLKASVEE